MTTQQKLAIGAVLTTMGGLAIVLGPALGVGSLGRPWPFIAGFVTGVATGVGAALATAGLLARRAS